MFDEDRVVARTVPLEHGGEAIIVEAADVADDDERVAAEPAHVAVGDVPAAAALEDRLVVGFEQFEHVDPGLRRVTQIDRVPMTEPDRDRADVLTVVAPVDAIVHRLAQFGVQRAGLLSDPAQTSAAVDDRGVDDRPGRARVDAPRARAAPVVDRGRRGLVDGRGDDRTEHEEAPRSGDQDVCVLAVPTESRPVGDGAIDQRIVVGERDRPMPGAPDEECDRAKRAAERCVVIDPGRAAHPRGHGHRRRKVGIVFG